ncbi:MAG: hypothetical protein IJA10_11595 [Lachnospiraceae bacterium]|nr:hypothetical protein [Lachnospiraceae bacterium]
MSKKTSKLLFLATATAAIGGAMYVFRDKIKESKILENSDENPLKPYWDKGVELKDKAVDFAKEKKLQWDAKKADTNEIVDVEDFSDQIFEENHDREYRTIHITSPEEDETSETTIADETDDVPTEVSLTEDIPEVTPLPEEIL